MKVHFLGTGAALSDPARTTTMIAFQGTTLIVVDCGADVVQQMMKLELPLDHIELLILSHEHPDHISGFPLLMERLWLAGRRRPLPVRGPREALDVAERLFACFDTSGWKGLPEIEWQAVDLRDGAEVWDDDEWTVTAAPGIHSVPVIGVRVVEKATRQVATYSADTEPAPGIEALALGADLLIHEATGGLGGHSTATDAAQIAKRAGSQRLSLVHLAPRFGQAELSDAEQIFPGVAAAEDLQTIVL